MAWRPKLSAWPAFVGVLGVVMALLGVWLVWPNTPASLQASPELLPPAYSAPKTAAHNSFNTAPGPVVRVRLLTGARYVELRVSQSPLVFSALEETPRRLELPADEAFQLVLAGDGWQLGGLTIGRGELVIDPEGDGSVTINGTPYRGRYRFVPRANDTFDLVNDLAIDDYLKSVCPVELFDHWHPEAYAAQAVTARTYALYEVGRLAASSSYRHFDLHPDQRSQMYGGMPAETAKAAGAVEKTAGLVLTYGTGRNKQIFKAYYSSCAGGVTLSAYDAFGEPPLPPLSEQYLGSLGNASPRYLWGPVEIDKAELTRRFRAWGGRVGNPISRMAPLAKLDVAAKNRYGRPTRFEVTDTRGNRFSLGPEEMRVAANHDRRGTAALYSAFFRPINTQDTVRFVEGRGWGHGVGLCQWATQERAQKGMTWREIVLQTFPSAQVTRAY